MRVSLEALYSALLFTPFVGVICLAPFLIYEYKKQRIIRAGRSLKFYLFMLCLWGAWFMTMLPFPSRESVAVLTSPSVQLIPFQLVADFFRDSGFVISDISTFIPAVKSGSFLGPVLNILLLVPTGYFLRDLFDTDFKKTLLLGFLISLFFELVQLSGLFFIYPRPYRVFDVDDLICNTLGACLGWLIYPLIYRLLAKAGIGEDKPLHNSGGVSVSRRVPAMVLDQLICAGLSVGVGLLLRWKFDRYPLYFLLLLLFDGLLGVLLALGGTSPGLSLHGLTLNSSNRGKVRFWQAAAYEMIQGFILSLPFWTAFLLWQSRSQRLLLQIIFAVINVIVILVYVAMVFRFSINAITHSMEMNYDTLCRVYLTNDHSKKRGGRQRVVAFEDLNAAGIDYLSERIYGFLQDSGYSEKTALRVRLAADSAMNDWLAAGFKENVCVVRSDRRFWYHTLLVVLICDEEALENAALPKEESHLELVSGLRLSYDTYREGRFLYFTVDIPYGKRTPSRKQKDENAGERL